MKFFYGYANNYVDITKDVFEKCLTNNGIIIPAGEEQRRQMLGYDPYLYKLKNILVEDNFGNRFMYNSTKEVNISFNSLSLELSAAKNPKIWWNTEGKYIPDPVKRLEALQKRINLHFIKHGGFEFEYPEQLMCMRYIKENDKVLEIGGNIGRTAHIIHTILNNPRHHVVMEFDIVTAQELRYNLNLNNYDTLQIETAALSKVPLFNVAGNPRPSGHPDVTPNMQPIPTITYAEICKKYNVDFDVLVADCEGSLYYIFREDPDMLNNIHTVIMENDYTIPEHKVAVDNILKSKGFTCIYSEVGVPAATWSCCFNNFYEVWKKNQSK